MSARPLPNHPARRGPPIVGPYVCTHPLGRGSYGSVYAATDTRSGEPVALKLPLPETLSDPVASARFAREADALQLLRSPHVCRYLDHGHADGHTYLAMERVPGLDLAAHLRATGPLPPHALVYLLEGLAHALDALHQAGIVHRDLKPQNVLLRRNLPSRPVLVDFGLVHLAQPSDLTSPLELLGSPGYLAPEVIDDAAFSHLSDLFALGVIAHTAALGHHPFPNLPPFNLLAHMSRADFPPLCDLPPDLAQVLASLTHRDPAQRPRHARHLLETLHALSR